jgi:hypothetical protein
MKKAAVLFLILCLTVTFVAVIPTSARANDFWPGLAVGMGAAILLGHLFHPPMVYSYNNRPAQDYYAPEYYSPPPSAPDSRGRWVPGRWAEGYDAYGNYQRFWIPEHWEHIN